ncbi:MAG TPA: hypothetical protein PKG77_07665 [Phycisphaerae bacterium]|nr:hypothetical protein [Phycisphaerae bacterium]
MNLQDFVSESLKQIVAGIKDAQESLKDRAINPGVAPLWREGLSKHYAIVNERILEAVQFDVAVTVTDQESNKKGIAVFAGWFGAGGQKEAGQANTSVSRIKFSVPVSYPAANA